jgi:hypothetical protein
MFNANDSSVVLINSRGLCESGADVLFFLSHSKIIIYKKVLGLYKFSSPLMVVNCFRIRVIWFVAVSRQEHI